MGEKSREKKEKKKNAIINDEIINIPGFVRGIKIEIGKNGQPKYTRQSGANEQIIASKPLSPQFFLSLLNDTNLDCEKKFIDAIINGEESPIRYLSDSYIFRWLGQIIERFNNKRVCGRRTRGSYWKR